ncbi:MAG: tRNA pseudouridine(13) synthase TruD, partial [Myxococcota bacterium]
GDRVDTHLKGFELLRGERKGRRGRLLRLELSAAQSALFNALLAQRVQEEHWDQAIPGDVFIRPNGRDFYGPPNAAIEALESGRAAIGGPIFGPHMKPSRDAALRLEERALDEAGLRAEDFERYPKLTAGTRRALATSLGNPSVEELDGDVVLHFTLVPGAYATVALEAMGVAPKPKP